MSKEVRVAKANLEAQELVLPNGLTLDRVKLQASSLNIQTKPTTVSTGDTATVEVFVSIGHLLRFLDGQLPAQLSNVALSHRDGMLLIQASVNILISLEVAVLCRLVIKDEAQIWVEADKVQMAGVGAKSLIQDQLAKVNPVFDASELPFPLKLKSAEVTDEGVTIRGESPAFAL